MPNVTFSVKDIERMFELKEFERLVDGIGMEVEARKGDDIVVSVTPNRPDLLSFTGLMRALMLHSGKGKPKEYKMGARPALSITVTPSVMKVRPFISGMVVKNARFRGNMLKYAIDFTEKLSDNYGRKRKKLAMGMHDMKAIRGNLTYDAKHDEKFVPLRGTRAMSFDEILKKHAKGAEYGYTISQKGNADYPFLMDSEKVLSLIPIINSDATKTTEKTDSMFVGVTGTDSNAVDGAARMMACMLIDMGADVLPVNVVYPKAKEVAPQIGARTLKVALKDFEETVGVSSSANEMARLAEREGFFAKAAGGTLTVTVPPYRADVLNDQDVIEDLAIAYDYSSIEPAKVVGHSVGSESASNSMKNGVAMLMVGLGFSEAMNYYLSNERVQFENMHRKRSGSSVTIAKAKTEAITMLREAVLPGLLQNLSDSAHERLPQRLFEVGSVFRLENGKPVEETHLAFVGEYARANFADAKSVVDAIARYLSAQNDYGVHMDGAFIEGRCASFAGGTFGEISPEVLESFKIEEPVVAGEMLLKLAPNKA